jgi:hypothetical protein
MLLSFPTFRNPLAISLDEGTRAVCGDCRALDSRLQLAECVDEMDSSRDRGCSGITERFDVANAYVGRALVIGSRFKTDEFAVV